MVGLADLQALVRHPDWAKLDELLTKRRALYAIEIMKLAGELDTPVDIRGMRATVWASRMDEIDFVILIPDRIKDELSPKPNPEEKTDG